VEKLFVRGTWQQKRSFSPAVITKGAQTIVWVAGHTGASADDGRSLAGDFDAQFRQVFSNIAKTLSEASCTLTDIVTMTVFLIDARYTTRMTELRTELFGGGDFPASAAIAVSGFATPAIMLEIQCVAVRP
jgi:2-iminobutanoate/2-iminopropanoate deaminase